MVIESPPIVGSSIEYKGVVVTTLSKAVVNYNCMQVIGVFLKTKERSVHLRVDLLKLFLQHLLLLANHFLVATEDLGGSLQLVNAEVKGSYLHRIVDSDLLRAEGVLDRRRRVF